MGIAEDSLIGRDDQVARERELEGPGEAESVHLRDDDGVQVLDECDDAASRKVEQVADLVADVLDAQGSAAAVAAVRDKVTALCRRFPVYEPSGR